MAVIITSMDELQIRLNQGGNQLSVICFLAPWCGACRKIEPKIDELTVEFNTINFLKVQADECEDIVQEYNVVCIPTFIFVKTKDIVFILSEANHEKLREAILNHK